MQTRKRLCSFLRDVEARGQIRGAAAQRPNLRVVRLGHVQPGGLPERDEEK